MSPVVGICQRSINIAVGAAETRHHGVLFGDKLLKRHAAAETRMILADNRDVAIGNEKFGGRLPVAALAWPPAQMQA